MPADAQQGDFRTSILTILPSVDIDCDSDNTATPTWHGIERSDWEEYIENEAEYPGKIVFFNHNDDNNNGIADYLEHADYEYPPDPPGLSWVPFPDPDLVPVVLDRGFADLTGMDGFLFELKVTADTDYGLRYWLDPERTKIVNGINGGDPVKVFEAGKWKDVYTWEVSGFLRPRLLPATPLPRAIERRPPEQRSGRVSQPAVERITPTTSAHPSADCS